MKVLRDTVIEIDLKALASNTKAIKEYIGQDVKLMAVVKANGYGHGATKIASTLMENGADYLAVATLIEALEIRDQWDYPILVMGHTPDQYLEEAIRNNIVLTVFSYHQAKLMDDIAQKYGEKAKAHIKIDTGFHRLGMDPKDEKTIDEIAKICSLKNIEVEGIFTHLALAGEEHDKRQMELFIGVIDKAKERGIDIPLKHAADSIATVDSTDYHMDMVRVGALLYGMVSHSKGFINVKQVMTFKTKISQIHYIEEGEGVGYDYLWKASRTSKVATLPFGYADGYPRNMRDKGYVTIAGKKCPLVGVLCMDQVMADVTDLDEVWEGMDAVIYGGGENQMTIAEAAKLAETNKNEIISRISARPQRIYVK